VRQHVLAPELVWYAVSQNSPAGSSNDLPWLGPAAQQSQRSTELLYCLSLRIDSENKHSSRLNGFDLHLHHGYRREVRLTAPSAAHYCPQANVTSSSMLSSARNTFVTFVALYLTTLFSIDTWAAARASPHRRPGVNTYFRPAHTPSEYQSNYNASGHRGGSGGGSGSGDRVGRLPNARDGRPPLRMGGGSAGCGGGGCSM
jgi:hypothetical protein